MINRAPFLPIDGGIHPGQSGIHTTLPRGDPTPHWLPVPHWGELKFPRVINPDSPLNDSRQLDWKYLKHHLFSACKIILGMNTTQF